MGDNLIIVASSDGFCSFISLQKDLVGERLTIDSADMPEKLREFYKMEQMISFETSVNEVKAMKN